MGSPSRTAMLERMAFLLSLRNLRDSAPSATRRCGGFDAYDVDAAHRDVSYVQVEHSLSRVAVVGLLEGKCDGVVPRRDGQCVDRVALSPRLEDHVVIGAGDLVVSVAGPPPAFPACGLSVLSPGSVRCSGGYFSARLRRLSPQFASRQTACSRMLL